MKDTLVLKPLDSLKLTHAIEYIKQNTTKTQLACILRMWFYSHFLTNVSTLIGGRTAR